MLCNILESDNEHQMSQSKRSNETYEYEDLTEKFSASINRAFQSTQIQSDKPWSSLQTSSKPMVYSASYLV